MDKSICLRKWRNALILTKKEQFIMTYSPLPTLWRNLKSSCRGAKKFSSKDSTEHLPGDRNGVGPGSLNMTLTPRELSIKAEAQRL